MTSRRAGAALVLATLAVLLAGVAGQRPLAAGAVRCAPTIFAPAGRFAPHAPVVGGPGLVLSGAGGEGMPYPAVLAWMRPRIAPAGPGRAGNLLALRASDSRDYSDPFYAASTLQSVQEILIPPCATPAQVDAIARYVTRSDAVFFAGGDQSHYVTWKRSALIAAVRRLYARGGIVGGGSAGLAIQGAVVYDAVAADRVLPDDEDLGSARAVKNPYGSALSFTTGLFAWPPLKDTITDTHFAQRNRFGRLAAFMARALRDGLVPGPRVYGLGVDAGSVLVVDRRGVGTLLERAPRTYRTRGAYVLSGGPAERIAPGRPLRYTVEVVHLTRDGERYDLLHKRGDGVRYSVTVDGSRPIFYDRSPY